MTASVQPATMPSLAASVPAALSSSRSRSAARPMITPIRKTTRPADSGGMNGRSRDHTQASAASTMPFPRSGSVAQRGAGNPIRRYGLRHLQGRLRIAAQQVPEKLLDGEDAEMVLTWKTPETRSELAATHGGRLNPGDPLCIGDAGNEPAQLSLTPTGLPLSRLLKSKKMYPTAARGRSPLR